jgi:hypothetical protein
MLANLVGYMKRVSTLAKGFHLEAGKGHDNAIPERNRQGRYAAVKADYPWSVVTSTIVYDYPLLVRTTIVTQCLGSLSESESLSDADGHCLFVDGTLPGLRSI